MISYCNLALELTEIMSEPRKQAGSEIEDIVTASPSASHERSSNFFNRATAALNNTEVHFLNLLQTCLHTAIQTDTSTPTGPIQMDLKSKFSFHRFPDKLTTSSAPVIIYGYTPSFALALFAVLLFTLSLTLHSYQILCYRTFYLCTLPVALLLEVLGYIFRSLSARQDPYAVTWFVLQYFFIVTAPVFLSAGIYSVLSVLIEKVGREYSPIPPKVLLGVFISSDAVMTVVQICGAAMIGAAESKQKDPTTGKNILMAGLTVQVFVFFIFLILLGVFLWESKNVLWRQKGRKAFIVAFVVVTVLVYLRTCFRLAEVAQGVKAYLFTHENFFACLEFAPIAGTMLLFNIFHPGRCLKNPSEEVVGSTSDEAKV